MMIDAPTTLPLRARRLLANVAPDDARNLYVILGDSPEARQMVNLTFRLRVIVRRAPQAMIRGRLTSTEFLEGLGRIREQIRLLRKECEDFWARAGLSEIHNSRFEEDESDED